MKMYIMFHVNVYAKMKGRKGNGVLCFLTLFELQGKSWEGTVENHVRQEITREFTAGDTKCEVWLVIIFRF